MLEKISLENFKGFKKLKDLKFKPITVLCGANSCGKSSILQSILLLKQTVENTDTNQTILFSGIIDLENFENIIFKKDLRKKVSLEFCFKLTKKEIILNQSVVGVVLDSLLISDDSAEYFINYKISLTGKNNTIDQLNYSIETKLNNEIVRAINIELNKNSLTNLYRIVLERGKEEYQSDMNIDFINLFPKYIRPKPNEIIDHSLYEINSLIQNILRSHRYIGPLRKEPLRTYLHKEGNEMGIRGENAASLSMIDKKKPIENHYFYDIHTDCFYKEESLNLIDALSYWFNLMKIKGFKPMLFGNSRISLTLNSNLSTRTRVNIADVGFGVGQIFPIILEGLRMSPGNTLLLEQPETHLHPKLQLQIADYFIALALSGKHVIIETHSDHIINRLVRRIVEDKSGRLKDLIGIHFITPTENGATTEEIIIGKNGIENWPDDFFDQVALEQEKIILAGLDKRNIIEDRAE